MEKFIPIVEGINAYNFPNKKEGVIRISLHSEKWDEFEKHFNHDFETVIRGHEATFTLSLAHYEDYNSVFILTVNGHESGKAITPKLRAGGFGQHLYADLALAADYIAQQFCEINKMRICTEMSHWPFLQYVIEKI